MRFPTRHETLGAVITIAAMLGTTACGKEHTDTEKTVSTTPSTADGFEAASSLAQIPCTVKQRLGGAAIDYYKESCTDPAENKLQSATSDTLK